jgi:hypothetical protein
MLSAYIKVKMINKENNFDLNIRWRFPGGREYAFAFIALYAPYVLKENRECPI